jgi:hypothetical protein
VQASKGKEKMSMAIVVRKGKVLVSVLLLGVLLVTAAPSFAATPAFGELYYNGEVVRTLVPPAEMTREGVDNLYTIPNQLAVTAVAPGDADYHGGQWAVQSVTWNEGVTPYLLTSADAVLAAASAGDVTITRVPAHDFKCPIQP